MTREPMAQGLPRPQRVPACPLAELAALLGLPDRPEGIGRAGPPGDVMVTGVTHASDEVRPGDLYAALPGSRHHGARFVPAAVAAGAVAVLSDRAVDAGVPTLVVPDPRARLGEVAARVYGDPTARLRVIGITGTAGKTTTAYLLAAGLRAAGHQPALLGTVETRLGDLVLDSVRTTPEATDLQALLAVALERGVDSVAMEVSSHALALHRVDGVRFDVGGWTNFGLDHLDFHGDADEYFAAKARLFDGRCEVEVINADDPALKELIRAGTVTFSVGDPAATWHASEVSGDFEQRFTAHGPARPGALAGAGANRGAGAKATALAIAAGVQLPGRHNVSNALLAIASLVAVGVDPQVAAAGVAGCRGVPGRLERVPGASVLGVVDYAHKPDSIVAVLAALRPVAAHRGGRLICLIGAGGDRDAGKRPLMGAACARGADLVIVTDDNPRGEDPAAIRAQLLAGAGPAAVEVADRSAAIAHAVRQAGPGDVIAVLGKGHERGQEIAGTVYPFDDRRVLAEALERAGR
jgi:UDP-N-acetylmuramoyl-L-alanyl-D-glutamate--2,6-diaminopimelate ligase